MIGSLPCRCDNILASFLRENSLLTQKMLLVFKENLLPYIPFNVFYKVDSNQNTPLHFMASVQKEEKQVTI